MKVTLGKSVYTQQDDIVHTIVFADSTGAALDITNWEFQADLVNVNSLTCKVSDLYIDTSALVSNYVRVLISRDLTVLLTPDLYRYDLTIRDANSYQHAIYTMNFEISKKVTTWG